MTTTRIICVLGAVLLASATLAACNSGETTDTTFSCNGGGTSMNCAAGSQYCEQATDGTSTTGATCRALPTGCSTTSHCGTGGCLASGSNGIIGCISISINGARATTVQVRR